MTLLAAAISLVLLAANAQAADVRLIVTGPVTAVNDSPFAGGTPTQGISVSDEITGELTYDDSTGQVSGDFVSFEIVDLSLTVPDTTQPGGSFDLVPDALNSATRIVFDGSAFQGLVLPNNVTGFEDLSVFGLTGVDFETSGFLGPDYKFNLGVPVVEGVFSVAPPVPLPSISSAGLALLAGVMLGIVAWARRGS
jgi:hypothetical protein